MIKIVQIVQTQKVRKLKMQRLVQIAQQAKNLFQHHIQPNQTQARQQKAVQIVAAKQQKTANRLLLNLQLKF